MTPLPDPLWILQQEVCDLLTADPNFASVPVIGEDTGDTENIYARAMGTETVDGGLIGACVTVATLDGDAEFENIPGPMLDNVRLTAFIEENVEVNRTAGTGTLQTARALAVKVAQLWHQAQTSAMAGPLVVTKPTIQRLIALDEIAKDGKVAYRVNARCKLLLSVDTTQAATPVISESGGNVTMTCATAGAAIFYTLDGSNPSPRNPSSALYTAPFAYSTGTLNARAWLAGYLGSPTGTAAVSATVDAEGNVSWTWPGTNPTYWQIYQNEADSTSGWSLLDQVAAPRGRMPASPIRASIFSSRPQPLAARP